MLEPGVKDTAVTGTVGVVWPQLIVVVVCGRGVVGRGCRWVEVVGDCGLGGGARLNLQRHFARSFSLSMSVRRELGVRAVVVVADVGVVVAMVVVVDVVVVVVVVVAMVVFIGVVVVACGSGGVDIDCGGGVVERGCRWGEVVDG